MSAHFDDKPPYGGPKNMPSEQDKQTWMLVLMSILCLIVLLFSYLALSQPDTFSISMKKLALDLIPGFVGALLAFVLFYFVFQKKGIDLSGNQGLSSVVEQLQDVVNGTRALDPTESIEIDRLYTLYGLRETKSGETFQDFRIDREGRNRNAVQFLWADTLHGNTIDGEIIENRDGDAWLRIDFSIRDKIPSVQNWGCNFAIKPQNDLALDNNSVKRDYLVFDARIPNDIFVELKGKNESPLSEVGLAIRVINGYMQHWEYGSNKSREFKQLVVSVEKGWQSFSFDLSDKAMWALFDSDDLIDRGPRYAIFDEIASLIIKVGKPRSRSIELEPGMGVIDIRNIRLSEFPIGTLV